jgi:hypothetical protein
MLKVPNEDKKDCEFFDNLLRKLLSAINLLREPIKRCFAFELNIPTFTIAFAFSKIDAS